MAQLTARIKLMKMDAKFQVELAVEINSDATTANVLIKNLSVMVIMIVSILQTNLMKFVEALRILIIAKTINSSVLESVLSKKSVAMEFQIVTITAMKMIVHPKQRAPSPNHVQKINALMEHVSINIKDVMVDEIVPVAKMNLDVLVMTINSNAMMDLASN